jgi:hypothetical protein
MTEWRDICDRCESDHDVPDDGMSTGHVCTDRLALLKLLKSHMIAVWMVDEHKALMKRYQQDFSAHFYG